MKNDTILSSSRSYIVSRVGLRILVTSFPIPQSIDNVIVISETQRQRLLLCLEILKTHSFRKNDTSLSQGASSKRTSVPIHSICGGIDPALANTLSRTEYLRTTAFPALRKCTQVLADLLDLQKMTVYNLYDHGIVKILPEELFQDLVKSPCMELAPIRGEIHYEI